MPTQRGQILRTYVLALVLLIVPYSGLSEQQFSTKRSIPKTARLTSGDHNAEITGLRFHYFLAGHGPLLVVQAPGWGIGSTYLQNGLAPLEKQFTLLFYDPRGSGTSIRPPEQTQMSTSDMVDDLEHLRTYWGLESFDLIGHSQGGSIAIGYAERYPTHVRRLALVETSLAGHDSSEDFKRFVNARKDDSRYMSSIAHLNDSFHTDEEFKQYFEDVLPFYFHDPIKSMPLLLRTITNVPSVWAYWGLKDSNNLHPTQQETELSHVQAATAILGATDDPFCPMTLSERLHTGIPQSQLMVFERSGQFPWIEQPTKFFDSITRFFER
jgi:pimeloyl-ACP methyl ester carboxylesterase